MKLNFFLINIFLIKIILFGQSDTLTLNDCLFLANDHNIDVKNGIITNSIKNYEINKQRMLFYPTLSLNVSQIYNFGANIDPITNIRGIKDRSSFASGLSLNYNISESFKNLDDLKMLKLDQKIELEKAQINKRDLFIEILHLYCEILTLKELIRIEEQNLEVLNRLLNVIQEKINIKNETQINCDFVSNKLLVAKNKIEDLKGKKKLLFLELRMLIGKKDTFEIAEIDSIFIEKNVSVHFNKESYKMNILQNNLLKEIIKFKKIILDMFPDISLNLRLNSFSSYLINNKPTDYNFFNSVLDNATYLFGINISYQISNIFYYKTNKNISKLNIEKIKNSMDYEKSEFEYQSVKYQNEIIIKYREYNYQKKYLEYFEKFYDISLQKYNSGLISLIEIFDLRNELESEKKKLIQLKVEYFFSIYVFNIYNHQFPFS